MTTNPCKLIACLLCIALVLGIASVAMASPHLAWQTERVYYDNHGRIVVEGYFYNNGTRTVTWVNRHDLQVYFRQVNTNWWHHASASYYDLSVYLAPGDSIRWTFRITNVEYAYFDYWHVKWNVNYNYR